MSKVSTNVAMNAWFTKSRRRVIWTCSSGLYKPLKTFYVANLPQCTFHSRPKYCVIVLSKLRPRVFKSNFTNELVIMVYSYQIDLSNPSNLIAVNYPNRSPDPPASAALVTLQAYYGSLGKSPVGNTSGDLRYWVNDEQVQVQSVCPFVHIYRQCCE